MIRIEFESLNIELDDSYIATQLDVFGDKSKNRIRKEMRETKKGGRVYRRGGKRHVASAAGAFPAIDTGGLAGSIAHDPAKREVRIGSGLEYAGYVNDGTSRMAARPYLEPGVTKTYSDWPKFMSDFLKVE